MRYLLKNISDSNLNLNDNVIVYNPKSKFGKIQYKSRLSRIFNAVKKKNFKTIQTLKRKNSFFFSKRRQLKSIIINIKRVAFSVENGFFVELLLVGLGFKVVRQKIENMLFFELHFSHKLFYQIPLNVSVRCIKKKIVLFGIDKAQLINIAEQLKALRYPNAYKGKGIKYLDEIVKLKPGKQR